MLGGNFCTESANPSLPPSDLSSHANSHLRNLFWICYVLDKELSLRTGRPPSLNDDDCDLGFPAEYVDCASTTHMPPPFAGADAKALLFPTDLRLSMITSRIYRALYSVSALRKSDAELLRTIRELDDDLEKWKGCLLAPDRLIVSLSNEAQSRSVINVRLIMLRLQYYHCIAAIHQASNRCKARTRHSQGIREGTCSSQELSIEASRSLLLCLRAARPALQKEYFW